MIATSRVYEESVDFIAAGSTPADVVAFRPSEAAQARVSNLLAREKADGLSADEKSELDLYLQIEHVMRLAKSRARRYLSSQTK